ncbi:MAG: DNA-processing protein DprA, partial [Ruminococcus sp.]
MNQDSNAILTLCSHICVGEGVQPLEPKEYSELAQKLILAEKTPKDLFDFSTDDFKSILDFNTEQIARVVRLLDRNASLSFELSQYQNMGIETVTRADLNYPKKLKKILSKTCPPIFYYAGDLSLLERQYIGYVGARTVTTEDVNFTIQAVRKTVSLGYGVVSGGAKGIDTISGKEALLNNGFTVEYLSDSLLKKLKKSDVVKNIQQGKLLLMSVSKPDAGFNVGMAMMRNRYIYAQSIGTVIIHSDLNKGGTWNGANENLKN